MTRMLLPLLFACATAPEGPAPAAALPQPWEVRFSTVRADLQLLETAHKAKDEEACLGQWELAYREHFEPMIEVPLRGSLQGSAVLAVEYDFGRLREAIASPRSEPTQQALEALRQALDELEQQASALPPPA